jgi:holin-like protein
MPLQDSVAWYGDLFSDARVGEKVAGMTRSRVADFARQLAFAALQISAL